MSKRMYISIPDEVAQKLEEYNTKNASRPINASGVLATQLKIMLNEEGYIC